MEGNNAVVLDGFLSHAVREAAMLDELLKATDRQNSLPGGVLNAPTVAVIQEMLYRVMCNGEMC